MKLLKGIGIGAGLMYLFDTEAGPGRRQRLRKRFEGVSREITEAFGVDSPDKAMYRNALMAFGGILAWRALPLRLVVSAVAAAGAAALANGMFTPTESGEKPDQKRGESSPRRVAASAQTERGNHVEKART